MRQVTGEINQTLILLAKYATNLMLKTEATSHVKKCVNSTFYVTILIALLTVYIPESH